MQQTVHDRPPAAADVPVHTRQLVIHTESQTFTLDESDAPILIGREFPAQIVISDDRISRTHVRIDCTPSGWVAVDLSRNGTYADGIRQSTIAIHDGMTIHLGHPEGIPVAFGDKPEAFDDSRDVDDDDDSTGESAVVDPGIAHAGAAVAARREKMKITQRHWARTGVVNAGALINFEKGRRWPRKATRTKIEDALEWPHGTLERIRREGNDPTPENSADVVTNTVRASLMADALEISLTQINAQIDALPAPADPDFSSRVSTVLADLRRLESVAANAAQTTTGASEVALMLSAIRRSYKDLMLRAARAPGASFGQRFYAARCRSELSVEEAANAAGVSVDTVAAAEADRPLDSATMTALTTALNMLTRSQGA